MLRCKPLYIVLAAAIVLTGCQTSTPEPAEATEAPPPASARDVAAVATATTATTPAKTPEPTPTQAPTMAPAPPTPTSEPPTATPEPTATPIPPTPTPVSLGDAGQVTRVIDGDTLDVAVGGETLRVRIIGVDTPETKDPNSPVMCYGAEATAKTQELVDQAGGQVILEKDVSETDRYGRYLRYVWLLHPDGQRMLNYELVAGGYAQVSTYPPDVKYVDLFLEAQRQARDEGSGLWGACGGFGVPLAPPTPTPEPAPAPVPLVPQQPSGDCDPSYPDVCIPSPPPDLDCADIPYRRFRVLPPDPHRFDGRDDDGWGCESG